MIARLNNKLLLLTVACLFFIGSGFSLREGDPKNPFCFSAGWRIAMTRGVGGLHPLHVSTAEVNHNATDKTLEISCKIFIDDFETCLSKQYRTRADLSAENVKTAMDTLVKKYITSHLQIKADDKVTIMNYLGFEKEEEAVNIYLEVEKISSVKKIEINDTILHDLYDDQISILHVVVNGNRKSTKLDYPNKLASFSF